MKKNKKRKGEHSLRNALRYLERIIKMKHKALIGLGLIVILLLLMVAFPSILAQLLAIIVISLLVIGAIILLWGPFKMLIFIVGGIFAICVLIGVIGGLMALI